MRYLILAFFIFVLAVLQLGFLAGFTIFGGSFNLIILILVSSFFLDFKKEGLIISLFLAAFYDLYLYSFFGLSIIAVLLVYFSLSFLESKISEKPDYLLILICVFLSSIIFGLVVLGGLSIKESFNFSYLFWHNTLPSATLNLIIAFPFYVLLRKIVSILKLYRIIGAKEKKILVGF